MKKYSFQNIIENNRIIKILSFVGAVLLWFAVALSIDSEATVTISGISITTSDSETLNALGLRAVEGHTQTVSVTVRGNRDVVGSLGKDDIVVRPRLNNVTEAGSYTCDLQATKADATTSYDILSVNPGTVQIKFDSYKTKKLTVTASPALGYEAPSGYVLGTPTVNPTEISMTGPESVVDKIALARVEIDGTTATGDNTSIRSTLTLTQVEILFYDASGARVEIPDTVEVDYKTVDVTLPVLQERTIPLKLQFTNVPSGIDTDALPYTLSQTEIKLQVPISSDPDATVPEALTIGTIDFLTFDYNEVYSFTVADALESLSSGYTNVDEFSVVTVNFPADAYDTKVITVSTINPINQPAGYNINVITGRIYNVRIVGLKADIAEIAATDFYAVIDGSDLAAQKGYFNVPVSIRCSKSGLTAWAVNWGTNQYEATISMEES